jgi:3-hydroxyacyl-CoA dehydrogenase
MKRKIKKVAVLGAGIMGSGIAAHLANCQIPCFLLDIVPRELTPEETAKGLTTSSPAFRNRLAVSSLENAIKNRKPIPAFYQNSFADLVTCGNLEDNLEWLKECDWIVEVVIENVDIKRKVFASVEKYMKKDAIVSSNTSGIPISSMLEGRSEAFKKNFLVTHFFNPVRFMKLLEIIPGPTTDPEIVKLMAEVGTDVLGKGVVYGKDTCNFVANRIGVYATVRAIKEMMDKNYTIEEVDAFFGEPLARPRTALFRTTDMVGLDTLTHIIDNCYTNLPKDECRDLFKVPAFIKTMVDKKQLGLKTKAGFFKKDKGAEGDDSKSQLVIDWKTGEYRPSEKVKIDSITSSKNIDDVRERIKSVVLADDRAGKFIWPVFADISIYTANRVGEIADDIVQIDNGMKWGYNWQVGPFESWDAVGFKTVCDRMKADGRKLPPIAEAILAADGEGFYREKKGQKEYFDLRTNSYKPMPRDEKNINLEELKKAGKEIASNTSASLVDIGDGVICCEFHSKMNSIDLDLIAMLEKGLETIENDDRYIGMVIGNQGDNFCVGGNAMVMYGTAQQANNASTDEERNKIWADFRSGMKKIQDCMMHLKYSPKPVVAAPFGMTLGGGAEISMGADRICAHADVFMGQVEVGIGLIPGAGGNKELLIRAMERMPEVDGISPFPYTRVVFETIAMAKVSMSAHEAQAAYFLRLSDKIVTNRDHLIYSAKKMVQAMHLEGYTQPVPRKIKPAGEFGFATFKMTIDSMCKLNVMTEHEKFMTEKLAWVLCGGKCNGRINVSEQYLLDLELDAFIELCKTQKTQERMQHLLMKGKPLRN